MANKWGYLLANRQGKVLFLNERGDRIDALDTDAEITAIAAISRSKLILGTPSHLHLIEIAVKPTSFKRGL